MRLVGFLALCFWAAWYWGAMQLKWAVALTYVYFGLWAAVVVLLLVAAVIGAISAVFERRSWQPRAYR